MLHTRSCRFKSYCQYHTYPCSLMDRQQPSKLYQCRFESCQGCHGVVVQRENSLYLQMSGGQRFDSFQLHQYGDITQLGECFPYKEEATGSSPVITTMWGHSSNGRTADLQSEGCGFKSHWLHH